MQKWKEAILWYPRERPWLPPGYDEKVVYAVRAVAEGTANQGQQQLFWRYLMYVSGVTDEFSDLSFRPGGPEGDRDMIFAEGKRFVGLMIRKLLRSELTPTPKDDDSKNSRKRGE